MNHLRCEKLTFNNPTKEFRRKLIKAGGVSARGIRELRRCCSDVWGFSFVPRFLSPCVQPSKLQLSMFVERTLPAFTAGDVSAALGAKRSRCLCD